MKTKLHAILQQIIQLEIYGQGLTGRAQLRLNEEIDNLKLDVQMMNERSPLAALTGTASASAGANAVLRLRLALNTVG